ncbi:cell surface protein [uncultured Winogradskyella sp.]|uniref:tetratricopeptide repeat protein n=1 Tax=uncultured Winogradskyella sp. TaxID=395353 RepID=UPI00262C3655|nr:cell surface protein [uncultured Winogradskyella sp.]
MTIKYFFSIIALTILYSCNTNQVTNEVDYKIYLSSKLNVSELHANAQFWTDKLKNTPDQFPYLAKRASAYTQVFDATGDISYLIKAEQDLIEAIDQSKRTIPSYLKSLATNYISQHRFKEALVLLKEAEDNGEKLNGTKKMLFDVYLELGNNLAAESYLMQIKDNSDFDYLIRLAKWKDHNGNLEAAIEQLEKAKAIAEASNLKEIKQWSYTNLADFYGHAGEIEMSYSYYLKALELDPNNAYAKKGIAWILYSHENNPKKALQLLDHISSYYKSPDYDLLKAEIAEYKNDSELKEKALSDYKNAIKNKNYGAMYNKYNILLYTENETSLTKAMAVAQQEVENRPTPQSYDLLAWSYFKNGDIERANTIIEDHVYGQTSEPEVLYHIAEIYKAVGKTDKVKVLKSELATCLYELGPTMAPKIKQL